MNISERIWLAAAVDYATRQFNVTPTNLQLDTLRLYCEQGWKIQAAVNSVVVHGRG